MTNCESSCERVVRKVALYRTLVVALGQAAMGIEDDDEVDEPTRTGAIEIGLHLIDLLEGIDARASISTTTFPYFGAAS